MSQTIFNDIDPNTTSGTELATLLNDFKDAVASGFSGATSRPANLQANGYWIRTDHPSANLLTFYLYDGTQDIELFQINTVTANIILSSSEDTFNIIKSSDDAIGPIINMIKGRETGDQANENDVLGEIHWKGRDGSAVEYTQAKITVTTLDDVTSSAHGANIAFFVTQDGASSLVQAVTITDTGKLGIGVTDPTQKAEVYATDSTAGFKATIAQDSTTGASMTVRKRRTTGNGQVLSGDTVGNFEALSTDNAGAEIDSANIKAVASENHTATAGGTNIIIERVKVGATALSTAITIDTDSVDIADDLNVAGSVDITTDLQVDGSATISTDLTVTGDLTVNGTTTTVNTTTLDVADANITINDGGSDATAEGAGLTIERTGTDGSLVYEDALASKFKAGADGAEIELANVSSTQTLSNKTMTSPVLNSPSISTPSKSQVKQDTKANLETYASTAGDGEVVFATDEGKFYGIYDSALTALGGGVGSTELFTLLNGDDGVGDWDTTNLTNATLVLNETTPLNGDADFKFGNVSGSTGEWCATPGQAVPLKSQSDTNLLGVSFAFSYDGDDYDLKAILWDNTNSEEMDSVLLPAGNGLRAEVLNYSNSTTATANIELRIEVVQVNNGKFLNFDDIEFKRVVYPQVNVEEKQTYEVTQTGDNFTERTNELEWNLSSNITIKSDEADLIDAVDDPTNTRTKFVAKKSGHFNVGFVGATNGASQSFAIRRYNSAGVLQQTYYGTTAGTATWYSQVSQNIYLSVGEFFTIYAGSSGIVNSSSRIYILDVKVDRTTDNVVVNSDTESDIYLKQTVEKILSADASSTGDVSGLQFDNLIIGKEYEVTGQILIQYFTSSTTVGFYSGASATGTLYHRHYGRDYNPSGHDMAIPVPFKFIAASTTMYCYFVKGSYNLQGNGTKTATYLQLRRVDRAPKLLALPSSKENLFSARIQVDGGVPTVISTNTNWLDPVNPITDVGGGSFELNIGSNLGLTVPMAAGATSEDQAIGYTVAIGSGITATKIPIYTANAGESALLDNMDFTIIAQKQSPDYRPNNVYVGKVDPYQVMIIEDQKASGVVGGTFTAGSWVTRDLNTISGDIFGSLESNQFTFPSGTYYLEIFAPASEVALHKAKLVADPNGTPIDFKIGTSATCNNSSYVYSESRIQIKFTITETTTFEVQHRCTITASSIGFGRPTSLGVNEIYTTIKAYKLS